MNTQEKIEAAGQKKEEGNALFKQGKYLRASKKYEKVWYSICIFVLISLPCSRESFAIYVFGTCP